MIKTKYDVAIMIDEREFNVVLSEPKKQDKEELKALSESRLESFKMRDALSAKLAEKTEEYELNKQLLKESGIVDKAKLLWEQKELNRELHTLRKEINDLDAGSASIDEALESLFKKRFDLLVSGADKEALKSVVETHGVAYKELFVELGKLVAGAQEKK
ncbi:MAG: hypothetical protein AB7D43_06050 [Sulfurimonadaceae bacterium]